MNQPEIIVITNLRYDDYGNSLFENKLDTNSDTFKVNKKESKERQDLIAVIEANQEKAIKVVWDSFKNKAYIKSASPYEGETPVKPTPPPSHEDEPTTEELATPKPPNPQEIGLFWKELGSRIGDGSIDKDYPTAAVKIKGQYYKKMSEITGVNF